ncbi:MAG TPA: GDYXXLXY domain-containing protein, partial [Gemmatimonadales bacterium]|nr:GDYXXLXY domain-containing protein [Gemmatimonadales bacterium]
MPEAVIRWVDVNLLGWLKARERKVLLVTAAVQLAILVGMIGLRAVPLVTGQTVLVRVEPVDPRDLFRGDYVILSSDFSRVSRERIEGLPEYEREKSW